MNPHQKPQEDVVVTQEDREAGFYWVLPVFNVDAGYEGGDPDLQNPQHVQAHWSNQEQPAYWTGKKWEMLGTEDWDVRWVGERVTRGCYEAGRRDMREAAGKVALEHSMHANRLAEQKSTDIRIACGFYAEQIANAIRNLPTEPLGGEG